jgi:hypothetical protein
MEQNQERKELYISVLTHLKVSINFKNLWTLLGQRKPPKNAFFSKIPKNKNP